MIEENIRANQKRATIIAANNIFVHRIFSKLLTVVVDELVVLVVNRLNESAIDSNTFKFLFSNIIVHKKKKSFKLYDRPK